MKPIMPWLSLTVFAVAAPLLALMPGIADGMPFLQLSGETYMQRLAAVALNYAVVVAPAIVAANGLAAVGQRLRRV